MPERRSARPGRRTATRERRPSRDERPDEDLEPDEEPEDEEPEDQEPEDQEPEDQEPEDQELEPAEELEPDEGPAARMSAAQAGRAGLRSLVELTGKSPEGVTAVEPDGDGWRVGVEVVEDRRVPSTSDVLAVYEATLDADGTLLSYRRVKRHARGRGDTGGGH